MSKQHRNGSVPWTDVLNKAAWYTAYQEVTDGKLSRYVFVPNEANSIGIMTATVSAYQLGLTQHKLDGWEGFQILIRVGVAAGQEIDRPYIEVIPERKSDG